MPGVTGSVLLIGGARSGKSTLAVEMGLRHAGPVAVIATATALDDDMAQRIARHRSERPDWPTIEEPLELATAVATTEPNALLLVDCITVWVSNLMWRGDGEDAVLAATDALTEQIQQRSGPTVIVTNEVGLGVHPETDLGRRYRDTLGRVNARLARDLDRCLLLVAGRALELRDPWEVLA